MQRIYTIAVGVDTRNTTLPASAQIAGMRVDNPSGSWLRLSQVADYVPPYTLGWTRVISPAALSVDVFWVPSPSGTPSDLVGAAATVTLYDTPQPNSQGYPSGAAQGQSPVGARQRWITARITASQFATSFQTLLTPSSAQTSLVPTRAVMTAATPEAVIPSGLFDLRTIVVATIWDDDSLFPPAPAARLLHPLAISPEQPFIDAAFPQGTVVDPGVPIYALVDTHIGGGRQDVLISILYYEIEVV